MNLNDCLADRQIKANALAVRVQKFLIGVVKGSNNGKELIEQWLPSFENGCKLRLILAQLFGRRGE
jgi:hypothetical protein